MNELRIKVAKARGWAEIITGQFGSLWGVPVTQTRQLVQVLHNGKPLEEIPDYPESVDACMELVEEMKQGKDTLGNQYHNRIIFEYYQGEWTALLYYPDGEPWCCSGSEKNSLPEAICSLYLTWQQGNKKGE